MLRPVHCMQQLHFQKLTGGVFEQLKQLNAVYI